MVGCGRHTPMIPRLSVTGVTTQTQGDELVEQPYAVGSIMQLRICPYCPALWAYTAAWSFALIYASASAVGSSVVET